MQKYYLMNKDIKVAEFEQREGLSADEFHLGTQYDEYLPYRFRNINSWLEHRQAAKHRRHLKELMMKCGCFTKAGFIDMTRCASLTDTFWVKKEDSELTWNDISLFTNEFDEVVARIAFDGVGMYGEQFSSTTPELSTSGSFEKCWVREDDGSIHMIKRGSEGAINAGYEPYSEALCTQLAGAMGIRHVPYSIVKYHGKLASKCPLFTSEDIGFVNISAFLGDVYTPTEVMEKVSELGFEDRFREMIIFDAISLNVDRHAGNYGVLVNNLSGEVTDFAPLFDHNLALLPYLMETDDVDEYLAGQGPKIGDDFIRVARAVLTGSLRTTLINLKDFEYTDPGLDFPKWKLDLINRLKSRQIEMILAD